MYEMIIIFVVLLLFSIKIVINKLEHKVIFHPSQITDNDKHIQLDDNIVTYKINTNDDEQLDSIYYKNEESEKLIIFAHGNAGNMYNRLDFIDNFKDYSVLMFDYRGYGNSTGIPSEMGIYTDIMSVWNYCIGQLNYNPSDIILYGESLGCSAVLWLGKSLKNLDELPSGIILQSGFYNLNEIISDVASKYLNYIIKSKFDNIKCITKINEKIPIMIIHSANDEMINIKHAYKLMEDGKINSDNLLVIEGDHNKPIISEEIWEKIYKFIDLNN